MKRQIPKITAIALASIMTVGTFTPSIAYAAEDVHTVPYSEFSQDGGTSRETTVTWDNNGPEISDDGTVVIIPKNLPLGKETKAADYDITVKGVIPYDKKVTVVPRDEILDMEGTNFYMHDQNPVETFRKADVPATVEQAETEWSVDEITPEGTSKSGNVSAPGLTFGSWKGILTFDINMEHTDGSHTHNFIDGNCTKCGVSENAGNTGSGSGSGSEENPSEHTHNFVDGVCTECGAKEDDSGTENPSEHTHNYTETITKEPTCTEDGEKALSCECGDTKTETIPAKGHDYSDNDKCTECDEINPEHTHSYTESIIKEPTCTEDGEKALTCECGDAKTETIPATGHNYADGTCTGCGEEDPDFECEHSYVETVVREGNCYTNVTKLSKFECTKCGDWYSEDVPAEHKYDANHFCTVCGQADMNVFTEPGLWSYGTEPVLRADWITIVEKTDATISMDSTQSNTDHFIYALEDTGSLNPYQEEYTLVLPDSITYIGNYQFFNYKNYTCPKMKAIVANGVKTIGEHAFGGPDSNRKLRLNKASFSDNLSYIKKSAFYSVYAYDLYIPKSVSTIGEYAFNGVTYLYYAGSATGSPWRANNHIKNW